MKSSFYGFPKPVPDGKSLPNIKSIQSGEATNIITASENITISSVDLAKSILHFSHTTYNANNEARYNIAGKFNSATELNFTSDEIPSIRKKIRWSVIEFNNVKSLQSGSLTHAGIADTEQTQAISNVNLDKSLLFFSYRHNSAVSNYMAITGKFSNATTLTFYKDTYTTPGTATIEWFVIEFN